MSEIKTFPKLTHYHTPAALRERWAELGWSVPCDERVLSRAEGSPLADPIEILGRKVGNRWCIHPMEGWDGTRSGGPTDWTRRRWRHFGESGAKLIWGCEAVAVRHDGRANPNQLCLTPETKGPIAALRETLVEAHRQATGRTDDLLIGLQLTHSGRFCKPNDNARMEPRIAYHHPILDAKFGIRPDDDAVLFTDDELYRLMDDYVSAARMAADAGFEFVDLKCCHGYLGHELLGAHVRPGAFGGSFENRTRFIRELIGRVRSAVPGLAIGVRLSAFDLVPFEDDPATRAGKKKGVGVPARHDHLLPYRYGFGVRADNPLEYDLTEPIRLLEMLASLGVTAINVSCGSPYYNPHIQRPAYYPPSDGYLPPEDPLVGVARQIDVVRQLKMRFPRLVLIGTGYSYLQEFLPLVAQAVVRAGWVDGVGLGRVVLSYPHLPLDVLERGTLETKLLCRTFSDCTTGPRKGLISGCYPLDPAYKDSEHGQLLRDIKRRGA
ncbi:MAG: NADH:flavin oxidoreductase [Phycisphaerae bacterium]|jgi:2,4-dienoyl-CoA reductase-like NADH-dependent reductase (Old Yellow Enzyme family)